MPPSFKELLVLLAEVSVLVTVASKRAEAGVCTPRAVVVRKSSSKSVRIKKYARRDGGYRNMAIGYTDNNYSSRETRVGRRIDFRKSEIPSRTVVT